MPLEASVCMLDNSDYAINSDVTPTRLAAAADAVKTIFRAKTNSNPESTCGLMTFAGKGPTVLVTPTVEEGKIHVALPTIKAQGTIDLLAGLSVAGLALKHRQDKNQRQRAIVLLSSPLPASLTTADLVRLGKKLKKNSVAVDVVLFGSEAGENEDRMRAFVDAVSSSDNSKLVIVPAGAPGLLSDHIKQSEMLAEEGFGSGSGGGARAGAAGDGGADAGGFDLDPNLDPELAMALRMSLQEEEARQAAARGDANPTASTADAPTAESSSNPPAATETSKPAGKGAKETDVLLADGDEAMDDDEDDDDEDEEDEDEELARALALSRGDDVEMGDADEDSSEEDEIARAIQLSMKDKNPPK